MPAKFIIYGLVDPRDGQLRYVGKSCSGLKRPRSEAQRVRIGAEGAGHKVKWIRSLQAQGLTYGIVVIQEFTESDILGAAEIHWIAYFRAMGCKLTNLTDGGEGCCGRQNSLATRLKMSATRGGLSPEQRCRAVDLYRSGLSLRRVGVEFRTGSKVIFRVLHLMGEPIRTKSQARGHGPRGHGPQRRS